MRDHVNRNNVRYYRCSHRRCPGRACEDVTANEVRVTSEHVGHDLEEGALRIRGLQFLTVSCVRRFLLAFIYILSKVTKQQSAAELLPLKVIYSSAKQADPEGALAAGSFPAVRKIMDKARSSSQPPIPLNFQAAYVHLSNPK